MRKQEYFCCVRLLNLKKKQELKYEENKGVSKIKLK